MTNPDNETKIKLIEDRDAAGEVAAVYDEWRAKSGRQKMPGILKCFSHRPDFLRDVMKFGGSEGPGPSASGRSTSSAGGSRVPFCATISTPG